MYTDPEGRLCFDYTGAPEGPITIPAGSLVELWGAAGANQSRALGGRGAYTSGQISHTTTAFIFVGGKGESFGLSGGSIINPGGWNGGGSSRGEGRSWYSLSGGGATDIALVTSPVTLDAHKRYVRTLASLVSRLMVAAGGGAPYANSLSGLCTGWGGGLTGNGDIRSGEGGQQVRGGVSADSYANRVAPAGFGVGAGAGGTLPFATTNIVAGGGAGYYGGGSCISPNSAVNGSGGGSSFISGFAGCNAVDMNGIHTGSPLHYSGIQFIDPLMLNGGQALPNPRGAGTIIGNPGHGFARITLGNPKKYLFKFGDFIRTYDKQAGLWLPVD